jgi:GntR family transcriptional regulator
MDRNTYFLKHPIDKSIPIPLYYQLREILLNYIRNVEAGTALPTEEELCRIYNISRPTARQAIRELETGGLVERKKGKGTFTCEKKINQEFSTNFEDFEDRMSRLNYTVRTEVLEFATVSIDDNLKAVFDTEEVSNFYKIRTIKYANEIPMVISLSYLPVKQFPELQREDLSRQSINSIIRNDYNYQVIRHEKTIEVKTISEYEASLLEVQQKAAVQYIETISYLKDNIPVEYTMERYRSDKNKFKLYMIL